MKKQTGVIIVIATQVRHATLYDPKILKKASSTFLKILIVDERRRNEIPEQWLDLYDRVEHVKTASDDGLFILHDPKLVRKIIKDAIQYHEPNNCYVFSEDEGNVEIIAEAITGLKIHGYDSNKAHLFRDKDSMKSHLKKFDIRVPEYISNLIETNYKEITEKLGTPFVVKPTSGAGSYGFSLITTELKYNQYIQHVDNLAHYQAEEYIDGDLFHLDSTVYNGHEIATTASEYLWPQADSLTGKPAGSLLISDDRSTQLKKIHTEVLQAFNVDGNFHAEYFINSQGEVIFLEIAWRQAGLGHNLNYEQYVGNSQATVYLGLITGLLSAEDLNQGEPRSMLVYIPIEKGVYQGLCIPFSESKYKVIKQLVIGTTCTAARSYIDTAAIIKITASNYIELRKIFQKIKHTNKLAKFSK